MASAPGSDAEPAWWTNPVPGTADLHHSDLVLRCEGADETEVGTAVHELGRRGGHDEVALGLTWLADPAPVVRCRGVNLLGIRGEVVRAAGLPVDDAVVGAMVSAAEGEEDPSVVEALIVALCWWRAAAALPWLLSLTATAADEQRRTLAVCLPRYGPQAPGVVDSVEALLGDPDEAVRDWACFAFCNDLVDADSPGLRERLLGIAGSGEAPVIRYEAIRALAVRGDRRVAPLLAAALSTPISRDEANFANFLDLTDAARALADPVLIPGLQAWQIGSSGPRHTWPENYAEDSDDPDIAALIVELRGR